MAPQIFERVRPRLERFMKPFSEHLVRQEQRRHADTFVQGLLSNLQHKNTESIAYRFGQQRMPLQWFVGMSDWDHERCAKSWSAKWASSWAKRTE